MYKGLAEGWQAQLDAYEKGKDDPIGERNTIQMVIETETTFFKHELSVDMSNKAQVGKGYAGYNLITSITNNRYS